MPPRGAALWRIGRAGAAAAAGCGTAVASAALGGGGAAWAKPQDTPDYLMPHYLTTLRKRYNHYASRSDDAGARRGMRPDDFVRSVACSRRRTTAIPPGSSEALGELFRLVDANGDGVLSFSEYAVFMVFLSNSRDRFEVAFQMFDHDDSGTIGYDDWKEIVGSLNRDRTARGRLCLRGGIAEVFFGKEYDRRLAFDDFWRFVSDLRTEVWRAEFRQYDPDGTGEVTPGQFARLVCGPMVGTHLPFYLVNNIRRLERKQQKAVSMQTWESFNVLILNAETLGVCLRTFTAGGLKCTKSDFTRAVKFIQTKGASGKKELSRKMRGDVDLIFSLFDRDGDGTLAVDEFLAFAQTRASFNAGAQGGDKAEMPVGRLFLKCLSDARAAQKELDVASLVVV